MKHKTKDLEGAKLDGAVAKALGDDFAVSGGNLPGDDWEPVRVTVAGIEFAPSTNWAQGGPIIEREGIAIWKGDSKWAALMQDDEHAEGYYHDGSIDCDFSDGHFGPTPLIAAMRAFVASKLGDEVSL